MGLLFNDKNDFDKDVKERFGENQNYLIAIKHNSPARKAINLAISGLYNAYDSNRTFILVFNNKGIYEKEISNSDKADFYLIPGNEIEDFNFEEKNNKVFIDFKHIGKKISYEIPFTGKLFKDNKINYEFILNKNWEMI